MTIYVEADACIRTTLGAAFAAAATAVFGEPSALLGRGLALGRGAATTAYDPHAEVVVVETIGSSRQLKGC